MKGLNNISVKTKLRLLAILFVCGMAAFGLVAFMALSEVKIGGSMYADIRTGAGISAHFEPSSGYLMGARLRILEMILEAKDQSLLHVDIQHFEQARKLFEDTHDQYASSLPDGKLKDLLQKAYEPARQYFEVAESRYIPLLLQGKLAEAEVVRNGELKPLFYAHDEANKAFTDANAAQLAVIEKNAASMVASRTFTLIVVALAALVLVSTLCFVIAQGILTPLKATVDMLHEVSQGNLAYRMDVAGADEIAQMGNALNETVDHLSRVMLQISSDTEVLFKTSATASTVSQSLDTNSQQTSSQATALSAAAEQVSQNIQTVSAATEEMSASIREISKNASEAAEVASSAARLAGTTNATMTKLSESSAEIGNVIKVITSIAEQTNLLALNATIEAARAGEAGKGFAVVANEVKELAKETAKATEDIGSKVEAIQNDAKGAVQAIDEITTVIGRINDIQNTIASAVEEQTGTTNEISRNVSETARGSSDIASNITGVAAAAKETQHSAGVVHQAAQELTTIANSLSSVVQEFKLSRNSDQPRANH
jgi:methyl-accepting chemotaxis protein